MKIGDVYMVLSTSTLDDLWWGSLAILEKIHNSPDMNRTLYQFRTHRHSNQGEELVHTTWLFSESEIKDVLKEVT